ncbi:MAG: ankyrin repeat domain-containing protein [Gammaproteobacteria bacterium]
MKPYRIIWIFLGLFSLAPVLASDVVNAVARGDRASALALISEGADVSAPHSDGTSALMYAAYLGDAELTEALLKAGADPAVENDYGTTAIQEAAIIGANEVMALLLEAGADANWSNPGGETALMNVARAGNLEGAQLLLEHGADIHAVEHWGGQTALLWAAAQSQPEMLQLLIDNGADINQQSIIRVWESTTLDEPRPKHMNKGGFTALHFAAREGCTECIKVLANAGADLDAHDPERVTPLNGALLNFHYNTAAALIDAGADVNKWDIYGRGPLFNAIELHTIPIGGRPDIPSEDALTGYDIAAMLLDRGANPNMQLKMVPPLRNAIYDRGYDKVLTTGATPLMRAVKGGDIPSTRLLLEHGALPDLPNMEGQTPMMIVAGVGHTSAPTRGLYRTQDESIQAIQLLLDYGADINALSGDPALPPGIRPVDYERDKNLHPANEGEVVIHGQTALHGAGKQGWTEVARFLITNGARQQVVDDGGTTPFDLAMGRYAPAYNDSAPKPFFDTAQYLQEECAVVDGCKIPDPLDVTLP